MKSTRLIVLLLPLMASCGFFKDYSKDNLWSYFEEWDLNTDSKIDKDEFTAGCVRDGFIGKNSLAMADPMFIKADENKDGALTGLEFYRWKIHVEDPTDPNVASVK
jgi:Ca2+-binding EF-hand superfamily protein